MNKAELVQALEGLGIDDLDQLKNGSLEKILAVVNENTSLKELNTTLNQTLSASEKKSSGEPQIITINKTKYKMTAPSAKYKQQVITAEVLKNNKKLAEELVKIKAGFLVKVGG